MNGFVAVADGTVLAARGRVPGRASGELVFTTAATGYEESLTDPSYEAQVLTFAYPLVGNYGVRQDRFESDRVHPTAVLARELTDELVDWLAAESVVALDRLDTRSVVQRVRTAGAMPCGVAVGEDATAADARAALAACVDMSERTDIGSQVGVAEPVVHGPRGSDGGPTVALVDCGVKRSIVDAFLARGTTVHLLPHDVDSATVDGVGPDVLFVSNGPGDPATFEATIDVVRASLGERPVAGICLGQQIVALAAGGSTGKLPFGHRGINHPVRDLDRERVVITTQNHGYDVDDPGPLRVTQVNVNDGTAEGLGSDRLAVLTRQYHPEAHPGPHDTTAFFDDVLGLADGGRGTER